MTLRPIVFPLCNCCVISRSNMPSLLVSFLNSFSRRFIFDSNCAGRISRRSASVRTIKCRAEKRRRHAIGSGICPRLVAFWILGSIDKLFIFLLYYFLIFCQHRSGPSLSKACLYRLERSSDNALYKSAYQERGGSRYASDKKHLNARLEPFLICYGRARRADRKKRYCR